VGIEFVSAVPGIVIAMLFVKAEAADLDDEMSFFVELLNPVVSRVGHINISLGVEGYALGFEELAHSTSRRTDDLEETQLNVLLGGCLFFRS